MSGSGLDPERSAAIARDIAERARTAEARREHLGVALAALRGARGDETADDEHDPEGPTTAAEWSRLAGLLGEAEDELRAIAAARRRLEEGSYGLCVRCGRPIAPARLEARPTAETCIDCARGAARR